MIGYEMTARLIRPSGRIRRNMTHIIFMFLAIPGPHLLLPIFFSFALGSVLGSDSGETVHDARGCNASRMGPATLIRTESWTANVAAHVGFETQGYGNLKTDLDCILKAKSFACVLPQHLHCHPSQERSVHLLASTVLQK